MVFEVDGFLFVLDGDFLEGGIGVEVDAALAEGVFDGGGDVVVEFFEDVRAALDDGGLDADAFEVVSHLEGDGAPAEDDDGIGEVIVVEDIIAGEVTGILGAGKVEMLTWVSERRTLM